MGGLAFLPLSSFPLAVAVLQREWLARACVNDGGLEEDLSHPGRITELRPCRGLKRERVVR